MRIVALIAAYNERRFIRPCLEHLIAQGIEAYLIDNESTDNTAELACEYLGQGLIAIESFPRPGGNYSWWPILERKEVLATELEADWFIHLDPDEIRLPPPGFATLHEAIAQIDSDGYNAVNFIEYAFVPTRESPNHDHPDFLRTMRWYYPYRTGDVQQLKAWQRQPQRVNLAESGGHQVRFSELRMYPISFPMRHYLFLSIEHAREKYIERIYEPKEVERGWHRARAALCEDKIWLQSQEELKYYISDASLDSSIPLDRHPLFSERNG